MLKEAPLAAQEKICECLRYELFATGDIITEEGIQSDKMAFLIRVLFLQTTIFYLFFY